MCGIGGFYKKDFVNIGNTEVIGHILSVQKHRGPDSEGYWVGGKNGNVSLCHSRLAILDLSQNASQPMHSPHNDITIVFNGEIYNWKELRDDLSSKGATFRSASDTEVLIEGYRRWGHKLPDFLRGMFSFAIYDHRNEELFLARDRVGKKPLVYAENEHGFIFSSEIPALLTWPGLDKNINHEALGAMLLHNLRHIPEPCTIYAGVKKLRPGHAMVVKTGNIQRMWRYWEPEVTSVGSAEELRMMLEESVMIRSVADVPVGALLSGGVDSTAIVNLMQRHSVEPVRTYAFGAGKNDEDLRRARLVAKETGTQHKEFYYDPARQFEIFKNMLGCYGEPIMLLPLIHSYQLSEAIRDDGIKVVLNGNGADELFYGYTGHIRTARITRLMHLLDWMRYFLPEVKHSPFSVLLAPNGKRKAAMYQREAEQCWTQIFQSDAIGSLENIVSREMESWGEIIPNNDFIDESNYLSLLIENSHSLTIASDLPAMMASVEMRAPFLDQKIISAAMGIHFSRKVKGPKDGSQLKNILRKAVSDLVPHELLYAPKRGFGMGVQERDVLLGPWRVHADEVFNAFPDFGLFDADKVRTMWVNAKDTGKGQWNLLAKLFSIGLWESER